MMNVLMSQRRLLLVAALVATALRLLHTATSFGSADAYFWSRWVALIDQVGILRSYRFEELMNHPPLGLALAAACNRLASALELDFVHVFRTLQTLADLVTAVALVRIAGMVGPAETRIEPAIVFLLSPGAIFISGFHGNSDPSMMMFVTLAVAAALSGRPFLSGVLFACAVGIKIVPLLVGPLFLLVAFRDHRERLRYLAGAGLTAAVIFLPAVFVSGDVFLRQVFGYSGMLPGGWGLVIIAQLIGATTGWSGASSLTLRVLPVLAIAVLTALAIAAWRKGAGSAALPRLLGLSLILLLVLAPSYGMQYLFWPLPFLWFIGGRRFALITHGAIGIYLFAVYTAWSGGWPWVYAVRADPSLVISRMLPLFIMAIWLVLSAAAVIGLRKAFLSAPPTRTVSSEGPDEVTQ